MPLYNHVAMITGGAGGLGYAIASALADAGADIGLVDIDGDAAEKSAVAIAHSMGRKACAVGGDAASLADIRNATQMIAGRLGPIDILINNVGIWRSNNVLDVAEKEWDRVFDVNVKSALFCAQTVAPGMIERKSGKIVTVASTAGLTPALQWSAYRCSKAAVVMLTRILALELEDTGVQVHTVCPSAIRTAMTDLIESVEGGNFSDASNPADITKTVLALVDPFDQNQTGRVVNKDGDDLV